MSDGVLNAGGVPRLAKLGMEVRDRTVDQEEEDPGLVRYDIERHDARGKKYVVPRGREAHRPHRDEEIQTQIREDLCRNQRGCAPARVY